MTLPTSQFLCPSCNRKLRPPKLYPLHCSCGNVIEGVSDVEFSLLPLVEATSGPGTEMMGIMRELGIEAKPNCSCKATAKKMDQLGIEGCEQQRQWIVQQLENNAAKWSWLEVLQIAASNATNPLALSIAFRGNIYHALLDEAISRAKSRIQP